MRFEYQRATAAQRRSTNGGTPKNMSEATIISDARRRSIDNVNNFLQYQNQNLIGFS